MCRKAWHRRSIEKEGGVLLKSGEETDWKSQGHLLCHVSICFSTSEDFTLIWLLDFFPSWSRFLCVCLCVWERESDSEFWMYRCGALSVPVGGKWCVVFMLAGVMPGTVRILDPSSKTPHWRTHKHTLTLTETHSRACTLFLHWHLGEVWFEHRLWSCDAFFFSWRPSALPHLCWYPAEPHFLLWDFAAVRLIERCSWWSWRVWQWEPYAHTHTYTQISFLLRVQIIFPDLKEH